ncbi:hypothetical protein SteCoe_22062 [Stentor coeruleus]|uniref:CHY-type domain-containing protein n=1 Tax=Stentor coeruleus TaxID=5963 RepID=A0A1R2BN17_9CILI|nr:hypothetical protein SteCoe_22062 [Stentor coeruleus]
MRPLYKKVIDPPVTRSTYIQLIKECCIRFPDKKEYIGACIKNFRDEAIKLKEKKNFKMTIKENHVKLVCLKVTGGLKGLTRTKYYVDNRGVYRYDWRAGAWECIKFILVSALIIGYAILQPIADFPNDFSNNMIEDAHCDDMYDYDYDHDHDYDYDYDHDYDDSDHLNDYLGPPDYQDSSYESIEPVVCNYSNNDSDSEISIDNSDSESENNSESISDALEDYQPDESIEADDDNSLEENIKEANHICKYWKEPRYLLERYSCCEEWSCCIYCHIDEINHKIILSEKNIKFCIKCSNLFPYTKNRCTKCQYNHSYTPNSRNICDQCRFFKNDSYITVKSCCNNAICCYRCHNEHFDHKAKYNNLRYICCSCNQPTGIESYYCDNCSEYLSEYELNYERIHQLCPNFTGFYYLLKFTCCSMVYCCFKCHDKLEDHICQYTTLKVCISCHYENDTNNSQFKCNCCSKYLYQVKSN